ncbi:MAG: LysM peptidoglycan-binding domain-containing protein [Bryobacterales bacterium]|nr:LysM peptidoglycan-binding domain-containing protein [Acidobacteriota bacterium]MCB9384923.1 LysM peptidoglycan-binding domain-containing protein [Bryobacterales bacterium]
MGVFDFIRNIGKSILPGNEGPEIQENITKLLGGQVENLKVEYDDGLVRLYGLVDSIAAKQKAVLLAGNVKGVEKVNDDGLQVKPKPEAPPEPEFTFYTIVSGDSLSKIAKKYYGDALKWNTLFEANREVIQNPDLIYPGQVIRVPKDPS